MKFINKIYYLIITLMALIALPATLQAQVYCQSGPYCPDYGFGFSQGITQQLLPTLRKAAAQGAALNNLRAMPARMEQPESFALGVLGGAAGGPYDKTYKKSQFLHEDVNSSFRSWPIAIPALGGSAYSGLYVYFPADVIGLPEKHTIGIHGSATNMVYEGPSGVDLFDPIESLNSERVSIRTRALGFRYMVPLMDVVGYDYLNWQGLQFQTGLSYSYNLATYRSRYEIREFYYTPALSAADINSFFFNNYAFETRTRSEVESKNLAMPLELRTGVQVLFLTLSYGPGIALNYGRHKAVFEMEGAVCNSTLGACSNQGWRLALIPTDLKAAFDLDGTAAALNANNPQSFLVHDEADVYSESFFVYHTADMRIHGGYVEWVFSGTISHEFAQASFSIEVDI